MNVLFVCSRNKWRSKTAEDLYKNNATFACKSAGTAAAARIKINAKLIAWADIIFVMEHLHKQRLQEKFSLEIKGKKVIVLNIEDKYKYMDAELVDLIKGSVDPYVSSP